MWQRPLFWSALIFAAGILSGGCALPPPCWALWSCAFLLGGLALILVCEGRAAGRLAGWLVLAGWGTCGGLAGAVSTSEASPLARLVQRHPEACEAGVEVLGHFAGPPAARVLRAPAACGVETVVRLRSIMWGRRRHPVDGRARLRITTSCDEARALALAWRRGDELRAHARVVLPRSFRNPGGFDARRYHRARGLDALASAKSARLVHVSPRRNPGMRLRLLRRVDRLRARLLDAVEESFEDTRGGRRAAAVAAALLLGERSGLSPEASRRLQEAGLSHLLAVSGFNVAVLAAMVLFLLALARVRGRAAAAACLPVLWAYLMLNRDESSVTRAVAMASLLLGGRIAWRRPDPRNSLGAAALSLLAVAPEQIGDAAFQLTFLATLALIELGAPAPSPPGAPARAGPRGRGHSRVWWWAGALIRAPLAATAGTLPLTAAHFNRVSPGSLPANLVGGPLMSAAFLAVIAIELIAPVWPTGARGLACGVDRAVDLVFAAAAAVTAWPWMSYRRPTPGVLLAGGAIGSLALAVALSRRARCRRGRDVARPPCAWPARAGWVLWGFCALLLCLPIDSRRPPEGVRITAFDVGQGDALLVETPGGDRVLVDAGGLAGGDFDIGEGVVSRALWSLGIARLDRVVVTHADLDHAGGAAAVARNFSPAEIRVPAGWIGSISPVSRALARALPPSTWLREVAAGDAVCLSGTRMRTLHPEGIRGDPGDNERSIVLSFSTASGAALLMGDAGLPTEARLAPDLPRARLLKVGHHGSRGATGEALLARTRPALALISCGEGNRFGHPHPLALQRLAACGARVLRTDQLGCVSVELLPRSTRLAPGLRGTTGRRGGG